MLSDALKENIINHISAIELCLKNHHRMPALILIYSGIDIFASLSCEREKNKATRSDFKKWCDKYLLPNYESECTASDIYAARCAVVHTYTSKSSLSESGEAKEIVYAWGNRKPEPLQQIIGLTDFPNILVLHIDSLFKAFRVGVADFLNEVVDQPELAALVHERSQKLFRNQSWKFEP